MRIENLKDWDMDSSETGHYRGGSRFFPHPYYLFEEKQGFQPNLSIVDLLFNMGSEGLLVLRDSIRELGR